MNTENLNTQELETLRTLLNKMAGEPQSKIHFDPVNKMIDDIMDEFNFAKVQKVMESLDWKWVGEYVTIEMLREEARRLLRGACNARLGDFKDEHWEIGIANSTGGFEAKAWCDESKEHITDLELKFVVEHWESSIEN